MLAHFARRLLEILPLLLVLSAGTFALADLAPGDFVADMRLDPRMSEEAIDALRARYGLDDPWPVRYGRWCLSVLHGDLGFSFAHNRPVTELVVPRLRNTLLLAGAATVLAWLLALVLGSAAAYRPDGWIDHLGRWLCGLLLALPEVLIALLALALAVHLPALPVGGLTSLDFQQLGPWQRLVDLLRHALLPVVTLALTGLPTLLRHVRAATVEALDEPWVRAARGHGLGGPRLLLLYVLPAAANPLVSLLGLSIGALLSGSMLIEVVLGWPGLGPLMLEAILGRDLHVVVAVVLASSALLIAGNLLADLLLLRLDPRIRAA